VTRTSDNLQRYHDRLAREEHRGLIWPAVLFFLGVTGTTAHYALSQRPDGVLAAGALAALVCAWIAWGLWRAAEWARWTAGLTMVAVLCAHVVQMVRTSTWQPIVDVAFLGAFAGILLLPSTRTDFARVRAGRARA